MHEPRLLVSDASGFTGAWREIYIEEWSQRGSVEQMQARWVVQRAFLQSLPPEQKVITLSVVHEAAIQPLDAETRRAVNDNVAATAARVKGAAIVLLASGFKAAVVRGIIATLTLVSGAAYASKTENNVEDALLWASKLLDGAVGAEAAVAGYRALVERDRAERSRAAG